jgi:hypothetical protein
MLPTQFLDIRYSPVGQPAGVACDPLTTAPPEDEGEQWPPTLPKKYKRRTLLHLNDTGILLIRNPFSLDAEYRQLTATYHLRIERYRHKLEQLWTMMTPGRLFKLVQS